ncbi:MAG: RNA 2',3'-cyclic phosphodiesterase [Prolixibacteraceae bacterium]|nr:RNA 2',3'-cyclic phosphodiesterase [Prolixibacteraceae bacterium]
MNNTIRTFIAIKIVPNKKLFDFIWNAKRSFSDEKIKWVNTNNLHLTLHFFGETTNEQVQKICNSLAELIGHTEKFTIKLNGVGFFNNRGEPKVLFVKIEDESNNLENLVQYIEEEVVKAGFSRKEKRFYPHLTLARIKFLKNKQQLIQLKDEWNNFEFQSTTVEEVIFYQSILNEKEPIYKPLQKFKLE